MLEIYGIDLDRLPHKKRDQWELLDPAYGNAWRERHPNLKDEHLAGSGLAGLWLLQNAGYHGVLQYDPNGRPYLADRQMDFNITHTARMSFCAIGTPNGTERTPFCGEEGQMPPWRVGIDAEDLRRIASLRICPMAQRWFTPAELEAFLSKPTDRRFMEIWTKKEALVKWTGRGLRTMRQTDTESAHRVFGVRFRQYLHQHTLVTLCYHESETPPEEIEIVYGRPATSL